MTKKEFETKKNSLLAEAKNLLKDGKVEDANKKLADAEALKDQYDQEAKVAANISAMEAPVNMDQAPAQVVPVQAQTGNVVDEHDDATNSLEYRKAFMNFVLNGGKAPVNYGATVTGTTEGSAVIPQVVVDRIVEKLQASGMILPLITQTSYKGGVAIPVSLVKPQAEWVSEGADASAYDASTNPTGGARRLSVASANMITFSYYKLKVKVAITLEMDVMAMSAFETMIVNNISEAITRALENAIINGSGSGQPTGILAETEASGQVINVTGDITDVTYANLVAAEGALPLAYENNAVWCMSKKMFMAFVGMVDSDGQPIARVNYGINGQPERTLLGRKVVLCEYVGSTAAASSASAGNVTAFLFNFKDYIMNTNLGMTVKTYEDNDTDDQVTKAVMLVDGKVVDKNSLVTIRVKAAAANG